ncbi:hypothetical protein TNCV_666931 [Trichonephila clavipes]|nr:hypothetical protein TNCV_666931 [Trichonephila clavipes]
MKREMSFICPQDVKNPVGPCSILNSQMLPSVRYLLAKVHGTIAICMGTAGGFDEEYCGQMMVVKPNRLAASRALLVPESFHFDKCRVHVLLSSTVVQLVLDPPSFLKTFNKL